MRAWIAVRLVRHVSEALEMAYQANALGHPQLERFCAWLYRRRRWMLGLASRLHRDAAGQAMIEECWWG